MRNGAFTTGRKTCNSTPVEARGCQLVPPRIERFWLNVIFRVPKHVLKNGSSSGQPYGVLLMAVNWPLLMRNCDRLKMGSNPKSKKGAIATGPAMVIRYSALETRLRSPPGNVIWSTGMGIL